MKRPFAERGRIRQRLAGGEGGTGVIRAKHILHGERMSGGLDPAHVNRPEFLHELQHLAKLRLKLGDLLLGKVQRASCAV
jgi:hypothetical protein